MEENSFECLYELLVDASDALNSVFLSVHPIENILKGQPGIYTSDRIKIYYISMEEKLSEITRIIVTYGKLEQIEDTSRINSLLETLNTSLEKINISVEIEKNIRSKIPEDFYSKLEKNYTELSECIKATTARLKHSKIEGIEIPHFIFVTNL